MYTKFISPDCELLARLVLKFRLLLSFRLFWLAKLDKCTILLNVGFAFYIDETLKEKISFIFVDVFVGGLGK